MSNKYLLFPLFGLFVPLLIYYGLSVLRDQFEFSVPEVGAVVDSDSDSIVKNISEEMVFTGDVLLARNIEQLIKRHGTAYPLISASSIFKGAPIVVGNFESAIAKPHIPTPAYVTTFSVDSALVSVLTDAGFTHLSLANNHAYDYGVEAFLNTKSVLLQNNLVPFGNPPNSTSSLTTTFNSGDFAIGLLALHEVYTEIPWTEIEATLRELASSTDYQIAYIHWGDEYVLKHNASQEATAKKLIDGGIDAVIGHHPHVTQDIQIYNDKPIFYSLGNFLFDQYFSVDVQQGLILRLVLSSTTASYELVPVSSEGTPSQPHLMPDSDKILFLKNLARRSDPAIASNIAQGKLILPINLATYP